MMNRFFFLTRVNDDNFSANSLISWATVLFVFLYFLQFIAGRKARKVISEVRVDGKETWKSALLSKEE